MQYGVINIVINLVVYGGLESVVLLPLIWFLGRPDKEVARRGQAGRGGAWLGRAGLGEAGRGQARRGGARQGTAGHGGARRGEARPGGAGRGQARRGEARRGKARRGRARPTCEEVEDFERNVLHLHDEWGEEHGDEQET